MCFEQKQVFEVKRKFECSDDQLEKQDALTFSVEKWEPSFLEENKVLGKFCYSVNKTSSFGSTQW